MKIFSNIIEYLRQKIASKITEIDKKKMDNFPKARERLLNLMIKKKMITEQKIKSHGILITFFGCGKLRHGPGTLASFATVLMWFGFSALFHKFDFITSTYEMLFWLTISVFLFIYGVVFIPLYEKQLNSHDHPSIVIDEVVGQLVALCLTYPLVKKYYFDNTLFLNQLIMLGHIMLSFIFFRFLDISKPLFIGWIDRNVKNSFGVMFDDLVCGLITAAVNVAIFTVYNNTVMGLHALV